MQKSKPAQVHFIYCDTPVYLTRIGDALVLSFDTHHMVPKSRKKMLGIGIKDYVVARALEMFFRDMAVQLEKDAGVG